MLLLAAIIMLDSMVCRFAGLLPVSVRALHSPSCLELCLACTGQLGNSLT
jgi:hypothetical protein